MNPIQRALTMIKFQIPERILNMAFISPWTRGRMRPQSVDEAILSHVIRPRVLIDCNLVGGAEVYFPISTMMIDRYDDTTNVYTVPKSSTGGRTILTVLNVTFMDPVRNTAISNLAATMNNTLLQAGNAVMDAHASIPNISTANCQIIGENRIMVKDCALLPATCYMRCLVEHDSNMSHLQAPVYPAFCKLVELAVKSYIYNRLKVPLDEGAIEGGVQIGVVKEIIDSYADMEELYQTQLLTKWRKISLMNDNVSMSRHINSLMGGYH